jgi:hypothetical protein
MPAPPQLDRPRGTRPAVPPAAARQPAHQPDGITNAPPYGPALVRGIHTAQANPAGGAR